MIGRRANRIIDIRGPARALELLADSFRLDLICFINNITS